MISNFVHVPNLNENYSSFKTSSQMTFERKSMILPPKDEYIFLCWKNFEVNDQWSPTLYMFWTVMKTVLFKLQYFMYAFAFQRLVYIFMLKEIFEVYMFRSFMKTKLFWLQYFISKQTCGL